MLSLHRSKQRGFNTSGLEIYQLRYSEIEKIEIRGCTPVMCPKCCSRKIVIISRNGQFSAFPKEL